MSAARKPMIATCNACGKLFPRVGMRLCTACSLAEQNRFQLVRDFLDEHGGGSVTDIAQVTGVSGTDVRRFLEGGRLVAIEGGGGGPCTCGGVGERCKSCRAGLSDSFRELSATMSREHADREANGRAGGGSGDSATHLRRRRIGE